MPRHLRDNMVALVLSFSFVFPAYAQPSAPQPPARQNMPGMDMNTMMSQCTQMRQQMKLGSNLSPDMRRMMAQCDQMDAQMNNALVNPSGPRPRTR